MILIHSKPPHHLHYRRASQLRRFLKQSFRIFKQKSRIFHKFKQNDATIPMLLLLLRLLDFIHELFDYLMVLVDLLSFRSCDFDFGIDY